MFVFRDVVLCDVIVLGKLGEDGQVGILLIWRVWCNALSNNGNVLDGAVTMLLEIMLLSKQDYVGSSLY